MPAEAPHDVVYWDASALLSTITKDSHSRDARRCLTRTHVHLVSSLAFAEVMAVLGRLARSVPGGAASTARARRAFLAGPWRWINTQPDRSTVEKFATRFPLRGADLWHLALYHSLRETLPELTLLTYDNALASAAQALAGR